MPLLPKWQDHCNTLVSIYRWRGRNRLSYLRTKTSYDSHRETSEHPLIYDDANIHFYRSNHASSSSNTYLMDRRPIVRDLSGLSQQVRTLVLTYLSPNRMLASKSNSFFLAFFVGPSKLAFDASLSSNSIIWSNNLWRKTFQTGNTSTCTFKVK